MQNLSQDSRREQDSNLYRYFSNNPMSVTRINEPRKLGTSANHQYPKTFKEMNWRVQGKAEYSPRNVSISL